MIGIDTNNTTRKSYKILRGLVILSLIVIFGTVGYMTIEGWDFFPSLYMTVITITTVGFSETYPLSVVGRIFTLILIFLGIGIFLYIVGLVTQAMVGFQISTIIGRKKLDQQIKKINDHYIVCGFGRIDKVICKELKSKKIPLLVIDNTPEAKELLDAESVPYIIDDATSEDVLVEAGIDRARGLISVVASDADNLFITLTARGLNHSALIIARADEEKSEKKLKRAGADKVFLPYIIGGHKMAQSITKPAVTDFLEFTVHNKDMGLEMEELNVSKSSRLDGLKLMESGIRQEMDIIIIAVRKKTGEMTFNPSSETRIEAGDTLIALGKNNDLIRLGSILSGN